MAPLSTLLRLGIYGLSHCFIVFSRIRGFLGAFFVASWNRILGVLGLFDNEIFIASRVSTHKFKQQIACDWIDLFRALNWQWELQTTIRNLHQLQTWHWRFFSWYREMILPSSIILTQPHKWLNYFSWCDQTFTSITFRLLSVCSPLPPGGLGQLQSKLVSDPETWRSWWNQSTRAKESLWNLQAGRGPGVNESDFWSSSVDHLSKSFPEEGIISVAMYIVVAVSKLTTKIKQAKVGWFVSPCKGLFFCKSCLSSGIVRPGDFCSKRFDEILRFQWWHGSDLEFLWSPDTPGLKLFSEIQEYGYSQPHPKV